MQIPPNTCSGAYILTYYQFKPCFGPNWAKFAFLAQILLYMYFQGFQPWWQYCLCQGIPMMSLLGKLLATGNYNFYTHQYQL